MCNTSNSPACSAARARFTHSQSCQSSNVPGAPYGPGKVATSLPAVSAPAVPKTVTSWPNRTSSRVSSQSCDSTLPPVSRRTGAERVETWAIRISTHGVVQQCRQHAIRGERFFGQAPGRAAVPLVIGVDAGDAPDGFDRVGEGHDAFTRGHPLLEARVLDQHGPARSQITHTAIAEPPAAHFHIAILGHAEFGARLLNELAIARRRSGYDFTRHNFPAVAGEHLRLGPHLGDAELLRRQARKIEELLEFLVALSVGNSPVRHLFEALPTHDRREKSRLPRRPWPLRQKNRRHRFQPRPAGLGDRAVRGSETLAVSEA